MFACCCHRIDAPRVVFVGWRFGRGFSTTTTTMMQRAPEKRRQSAGKEKERALSHSPFSTLALRVSSRGNGEEPTPVAQIKTNKNRRERDEDENTPERDRPNDSNSSSINQHINSRERVRERWHGKAGERWRKDEMRRRRFLPGEH